MLHHITIGVQDFDSATGDPVSDRWVTVDTDQDETTYHVRIGRDDTWPPCRCPMHYDPATGQGTRLTS